jgi:hypothetical protein
MAPLDPHHHATLFCDPDARPFLLDYLVDRLHPACDHKVEIAATNTMGYDHATQEVPSVC